MDFSSPYLSWSVMGLALFVQVLLGALLGAIPALVVAPTLVRQIARSVSEDKHWTELARELWVTRHVWWMSGIIIGICCVLMGNIGQSREAILPVSWLIAIRFAVAMLVFQVTFKRPKIRRDEALPASWRSALVELIVFSPRLALAILFFVLMPHEWSVWWVLLHLGLVFVSMRGGDLRLARILGLVRPAPAAFQEQMRALSQRIAIETVTCLEIDSQRAKTVSWPRQGVVGVTSKMLQALSSDEAVRLCAGELAQFTEPQLVRLARGLTRSLPWLTVSLWHVVLAFDFYVLVLMPLLLGLAFVLKELLGTIMRRGDMHVDAIVQIHAGGRAPYAHALAAQFQHEFLPVVAPGSGGRFGHLYDRLLECGVDPGYARPQPPLRRMLAKPLAVVLLWAGAVFGSYELLGFILPAEGAPYAAIQAQIATFGVNTARLTALAQHAYDARAYGDALVVYRDILKFDPDDATVNLWAALAASQLRQCELAETLWSKGERIVSLWHDQYPMASLEEENQHFGIPTSWRASVAVTVLECVAKNSTHTPLAH